MFKEIETGRYRLRAFRESDLHPFTAYRSEPEIARFQSWTSYSYQDAQALYADLMGKAFGLAGEWYQIALADTTTDALMGDFALHFVEPGIIEVGFTIAPTFQGKGLAKAGLLSLLNYLFTDLDVRQVLAITDTQNLASIGVLKSVGFKRATNDARQVVFKGQPGEEFEYVYTAEAWLARAPHE